LGGEDFCQASDGWGLEDLADGQAGAGGRFQAGSQAHGQKRVAAKGEEAVMAADLLQVQQFGDGLGHLGFCRADGRFKAGAGGFMGDLGQGFAVQFARGCERQMLNAGKGLRDHVFGQAAGQIAAQRAEVQRVGIQRALRPRARIIRPGPAARSARPRFLRSPPAGRGF